MNSLPIAAVFIFIIPIILIAGLIKWIGKRSDFYENIMLSSGSVLLSILFFLGLYSWFKGHSAFDALWNSFRQAFMSGPVNAGQMLSFYHEMGLFQNFTTAEQLVEFLIGQIKVTVPAVILLFSLIYGVLLFLIIRLIIKKMGFPTPAVPEFEDWTLPRGMAAGLIILLLVSLLGNSLAIANFEVIQLTIAALVSFLFTVLGISVLWFFLKVGQVPSVLRWLIAVLACLFVGLALPFLGVLDQVIHIRLRYKNKFRMMNGG
ncbi:MAG: DUF2232 domain-containing protein [Caldicoprobacterales bacterium]|jgi:uncharacterized protein YybS (DUF2232 family)